MVLNVTGDALVLKAEKKKKNEKKKKRRKKRMLSREPTLILLGSTKAICRHP